MTTSLPPPSSAYTTPPNSQGNHQFSPLPSASGTPTNISPTSPHHVSILPTFPLATKQLRPPKLPLYVPAVLRPTERPNRPSPLTPPRSVHGSTDSLNGRDGGRPRSRRSTGDSRQGTDSDAPVESPSQPDWSFGAVEGLPTRDHWKPDANATICDAPTCHKTFNLFERRHHCRRCGHVFCNNDSHYTVLLDHRADFHPEGNPSRACKHCWDRYGHWKTAWWARAGGRDEDGDGSDTGSTTTPTTPVSGGGMGAGAKPIGGGGGDDGPKSAVAGSAPRDWSWSTF